MAGSTGMCRRHVTDRGSRARRFVALASLSFLAWAASACYSHTPVSYESLAPHQHVRAVLASASTDEMNIALGANGAVVEGELVEKTDDSIYLLIPAAVREPGFRIQTLHQRLLVARQDITRIER